jgi:hypothetical protein
MTQKEIFEGNKLIAEFMNFSVSDHTILPDRLVWYDWDGPREVLYHSSWDWLMPVVEKIENLGYYVNILTYTTDGSNIEFGCQITKYNEEDYQYKNLPLKFSFGKTKLEETYLQTIEFIKWYNNEQKKIL